MTEEEAEAPTTPQVEPDVIQLTATVIGSVPLEMNATPQYPFWLMIEVLSAGLTKVCI